MYFSNLCIAVFVYLQLQLDEATETIEAASRLSEQLDRKEEIVRALRDEGESVCDGGNQVDSHLLLYYINLPLVVILTI